MFKKIYRALTHVSLTQREKEYLNIMLDDLGQQDQDDFRLLTGYRHTLGGVGEHLILHTQDRKVGDPFPSMIQLLPTFHRRNMLRSIFHANMIEYVTLEEFRRVLRYFSKCGIPRSLAGNELIQHCWNENSL